MRSRREEKLLDRAVDALKMARRAYAGLLCGWAVNDERIDKQRLDAAEQYMKEANTAFQAGDWREMESALAWAYHYAVTCGGPR